MKTGNAILTIFFWTMAFMAPIGILVAINIQQLQNLKQYIPFGLKPELLAFIISVVFLALGCAVGAFGVERKKKIKEEVEEKIELRPTPVDDELFS